MEELSWQIISAGIGLFAIVGGGGLWMGRLQNRVQNNEEKNERFQKQINGHLNQLSVVSMKVAVIETLCSNISDRLKEHDTWERARYEDGSLPPYRKDDN
jgi:hypothetical protein